MKLSEQQYYCGIANTYCATVTGLKADNAALQLDRNLYDKGWDAALERIALLEAKLTAIECGDCHKTMLECKCDD